MGNSLHVLGVVHHDLITWRFMRSGFVESPSPPLEASEASEDDDDFSDDDDDDEDGDASSSSTDEMST